MFELKHFSDVLIMEVSGVLNLNNVRQFDKVLSHAMNEEVGRVVLDFSELEHIDYKLVAHLVDRIIEIQCQGGGDKIGGRQRLCLEYFKGHGL